MANRSMYLILKEKLVGPAHGILSLIPYVRKPLSNAQADAYCGTRGLNFGLSLHLHQSLYMVSLRCSPMQKVQKSRVLAHFNKREIP